MQEQVVLKLVQLEVEVLSDMLAEIYLQLLQLVLRNNTSLRKKRLCLKLCWEESWYIHQQRLKMMFRFFNS
jgi:hypothetical protein